MLGIDLALAPLASPTATAAGAAVSAGGLGLLVTAVLLGVRHGIDWDHIAAITDITSSTAAGGAGDRRHADEHEIPGAPRHDHGGPSEVAAHVAGPGAAALTPAALAIPRPTRGRALGAQVEAIRLGTLYALGHALVVAALGLGALAFGTVLPDWVDPIMGRLVGVTLLVLDILRSPDISPAETKPGIDAAAPTAGRID